MVNGTMADFSYVAIKDGDVSRGGRYDKAPERRPEPPKPFYKNEGERIKNKNK